MCYGQRTDNPEGQVTYPVLYRTAGLPTGSGTPCDARCVFIFVICDLYEAPKRDIPYLTYSAFHLGKLEVIFAFHHHKMSFSMRTLLERLIRLNYTLNCYKNAPNDSNRFLITLIEWNVY